MVDAAIYTAPALFQEERREIFAQSWQIIGDLHRLAEPGRYVCANLAGNPVFVIRDQAGDLRAFRNVCRHQQLPVLDNGVGRCDGDVRCRYHGWTYDLSGLCINAPPAVRPDDFDATEYRLDTVSFGEWRGMVAVVDAADAPPLAGAFEGIDSVFDRTDFGSPAFVDAGVVPVFANWKAIVDEMVAGAQRALPAVATTHPEGGLLIREGDGEVWLWRAPTLAIHGTTAGMTVQQVVPRTFLKSEIHWYAFGKGAVDPAAFCKDIRVASEARQKAIKTEGNAPDLADAAAAAAVADHYLAG